jgi:hypothetical protein
MKTFETHFPIAKKYQFNASNFNDAFYNPKLKYSLRHIAFMGNISNDIITEALKKSLQICYLADINSKQHFKQVFLYNEHTNTLQIDCFMSKKGFNLMLMQISLLNKKLAVWLWKLSEQ